MFVRSQALLATSVALLGFGVSCSDPDLPTDLRTSGPPEVLAVLIMNDPGDTFEQATFCKTQGPEDGAQGAGDPKRPSQVDDPEGQGTTQLCPNDLTMGVPEVTNAFPPEWYVRIMFSELLTDSVEDLVPILNPDGTPSGNFSGTLKNTQPVALACNSAAVPYDGYYQPSGNAFTWPVGPSLFIQPDDSTTVPTNAACTVTINPGICLNKAGNDVPKDQLGPYTFAVAPIAMLAVTPAAGESATDPTTAPLDSTTPIVFTFNDDIDPTSFTKSDVNLFKNVGADCTGGTQLSGSDVGLFQQTDGMTPPNVVDPTSIEIYDLSAGSGINPDPADPTQTGILFTPGVNYRVEIPATATVSDIAGGSGNFTFPADAMGNPVTEVCFQAM